jgi:hypothetical protein
VVTTICAGIVPSGTDGVIADGDIVVANDVEAGIVVVEGGGVGGIAAGGGNDKGVMVTG